MSAMLLTELQDVVGPGHVSVSEADRIAHSVDFFWISRYWVHKGQTPVTPDYIVYPDSARQVSDVLKIAQYYKTPVTVWGGGSGSQGGALPVMHGIILDTKRMNRILDINTTNYTVTAETGIIQHNLEGELNKRGLSTMHLPASGPCATMGGFLAHRGTGVLSTKYGKSEDLIVNMEVVLPDGEIIETVSVPRNAAGPDLNQLFLGSEGTYGVITKATVKIFDEPEVRSFRAYMFPNMHTALEAGRTIMVRRLQPCTIRLYDENETVHQIERVLGVKKTGCYMTVGFDGYKEIVDVQERLARDICMQTAYEELGGELGQRWWNNKYKFFYPPYIMDLPQAFGTMDTVAPYDKLETIYRAMKEAAESFTGVHFIAHFSHWYEWGAMMYDRFILDEEHLPADPEETICLHNAIWNKCIGEAAKYGGVVNEHHGIGLKLSYLMRKHYGSSFKVMQSIKKALDPAGIMNPTKLGL